MYIYAAIMHTVHIIIVYIALHVANSSGSGSKWSEWTICNKPCGSGSRTRVCSRDASNINLCQDVGRLVGYVQVSKCNEGRCPSWSIWGSWSQCSVTCGYGQLIRTRPCLYKLPAKPLLHCGAKSLGESRKTCNKGLCSLYRTGQWQQWEAWSRCTGTCGNLGQKTRKRQCQLLPNTNCPGSALESLKCQQVDCPDEFRNDLFGGSFNLQVSNIFAGLGLGNLLGQRSMASGLPAQLKKADLLTNLDDLVSVMPANIRTQMMNINPAKRRAMLTKLINDAPR